MPRHPGSVHTTCTAPYQLLKAESLRVGDYLRGEHEDWLVEEIIKPTKTPRGLPEKYLIVLRRPSTGDIVHSEAAGFRTLCVRRV